MKDFDPPFGAEKGSEREGWGLCEFNWFTNGFVIEWFKGWVGVGGADDDEVFCKSSRRGDNGCMERSYSAQELYFDVLAPL